MHDRVLLFDRKLRLFSKEMYGKLYKKTGRGKERFCDMEKIRAFYTKDLRNLQLVSTSKGNQRKWIFPEENLWIKEQFQYQERLWKDYLVEIIASTIAKQMNTYNIWVIQQKHCLIYDGDIKRHGVYSKDFGNGNNFISFHRILNDKGILFPDYQKPIEAKWDFTLDILSALIGKDAVDYLVIMTIIDYLVGNEDRHINNFGIMSDFIAAPLFDFGLGLFEHDRRYENCSFQECLQLMECKPFDADNQKVIDFLDSRYDFHRYLPEKLDLSDCEIPTSKAGSYLRNRCRKLGIDLEGVE